MANITGQHTLNGKLILEVDSAPNTGGGATAPVGSIALYSAGLFLKTGSGNTDWVDISQPAGDVNGPGSSTSNAAARFSGTDGKTIKNSSVIISDTNEVSGITQLDADNIRIDGNSISTTDTNGALVLEPNGTGAIYVRTGGNNHFTVNGTTSDVDIGRATNQTAVAGATNALKLHTINASNQSNFIGHKASNTLTSSSTYTWPNDGTANTFLQTNGAGTLSWGAVPAATATTSGLVSCEDSGSFSISITGAATTSATVNYYKVGKLVTLQFPQTIVVATSTNPFNVAGGSVPEALQPIDMITYMGGRVQSAGVAQTDPGLFVMQTFGAMSWFKAGNYASFDGTGTCGFFAFAISYLTA